MSTQERGLAETYEMAALVTVLERKEFLTKAAVLEERRRLRGRAANL